MKQALFNENKPEIFIEGLRLARTKLEQTLSKQQILNLYNRFVTECFSKAKNESASRLEWRKLCKAHMKFICEIIVKSDKFSELEVDQLNFFTIYANSS
jgi:hypothetical protein